MKATLNRWGRIDVLVNNAGGKSRLFGGTEEPFWEMDEEMWDAVVDLNLKGTFLCTKAVAPQMIKQGEGHIINVGSGQRGCAEARAPATTPQLRLESLAL